MSSFVAHFVAVFQTKKIIMMSHIVFVNVFGILTIILDEAACASLFRNKRWNENISCPHYLVA